jgi:hypothetical protein
MPRSLPAEVFQAFRYPTADPQLPKGKVEVFTCSSAGAEAEHIAEILRSAHLRDNLAWTDMAVLVRAGRTTIPGLSRALVAGSSGRRSRLCAFRRGGTVAAHLTARWHGQHVYSASRQGAP